MKRKPHEVHQVDVSCWWTEENGVRVFLITGTEKALLIDTGFAMENIRENVDDMTNLPLTLGKISV
jgi:hydroxyacylglutathione hydrolase